MIQNGPRIMAPEIEIGVMSQVDGSGFIGGSQIVDAQFILIIQSELNGDGQISGISLVAFRAIVGKQNGRRGVDQKWFGLPDNLAEAAQAAMQMMGTGVGRQAIVPPVEREPRVGGAKCHAANRAAEVGAVGLIGWQLLEAQHNVRQLTVAVREMQFG